MYWAIIEGTRPLQSGSMVWYFRPHLVYGRVRAICIYCCKTLQCTLAMHGAAAGQVVRTAVGSAGGGGRTHSANGLSVSRGKGLTHMASPSLRRCSLLWREVEVR